MNDFLLENMQARATDQEHTRILFGALADQGMAKPSWLRTRRPTAPRVRKARSQHGASFRLAIINRDNRTCYICGKTRLKNREIR